MKKYFLLLIITFVVQYYSYAQKLPNKQETSVRAPSLVKIDGKTNEWGTQFLAYNHATEIYYTIANDDRYLYFIAKATKEEIINKLYAGGLVLNITSTLQKKNDNKLSVAFPVYEKNDLFHVNLRLAPKAIADSPLTVIKVDSFMKVTNMRLSAKAKWIAVSGAKNLDSLVSVYNDNGIKAAAAFNYSLEYNVEFAIDLKYIKPYLNANGQFRYHVVSNGIGKHVMMDNVVVTTTIMPNGVPQYKMDIPIDMTFMNKLQAAVSVTDFWGEYTLAK